MNKKYIFKVVLVIVAVVLAAILTKIQSVENKKEVQTQKLLNQIKFDHSVIRKSKKE